MKIMPYLRLLLISGALIFSSCQQLISQPASINRSVAQDFSETDLLEKSPFPEEWIIKNILDSNSRAKVVFNLPPFINPGRAGILNEMLATIDSAKQSIRMSLFQFNHAAVFASLEKAASRGVKVFLTTDLCYSDKPGYKEYFEHLRFSLQQYGQDPVKQIVDDKTSSCDTMFNHNKYMIVDHESGEVAKAWFGSFNPTNHGAVENVELAIVVQDRKAADILMLDFQQQINGIFKVNKRGIYQVTNNGQSSVMALSENELKNILEKGSSVSYPVVRIGEAEFEFILSPKVKSLTRIIEEVYAAKEEILFSSFAIADQMLISSLINKSDTSEGPYNHFSILALPHPGEKEGVVFNLNGSPSQQKILFEKKPGATKPDAQTLAKLSSIAKEIDQTVATPVNYLTPNKELKGIYRYFYPRGPEGGIINKVRVEGIFNSRVINEKTTFTRLEEAGLSIYKSTLTGELHNKLFIIDQEKTIFGSHNFSQSAENTNDELTVIVKSKKLAQLLKSNLFDKTKLLSYKKGNPESYSGKARLLITEIMSDSLYKLQKNKRLIDAGDFVEITNLSDRPVNLLGFRLDDHYFPNENNETLNTSTNPGFMGTLVRFQPSRVKGELGTLDYHVKENTLPGKRSALIVGKYFHEDFYLENFRQAFRKLHNRDPQEHEKPLLFSFGEYFSSVLGDSSTGLMPKDKITLYGVDGMTALDRFAFPQNLKPGNSLYRKFKEDEMTSRFERRQYRYQENKYTLKNGKTFLDASFVPEELSTSEEWAVSEKSSPGVVSFNNRAIASTPDVYAIEGFIADVHTNKWIEGTIVVREGKISDIVKTTMSPIAPIIKDVLIFPGLIDTHNHIKYNTMPVWITNKSYQNRDEWPDELVYRSGIKEIYKSVYGVWPQCENLNETEKNKCLALNRCKILRYAEMKALVGGTTSIQGSSSFDESTSDLTFRGLTPYTVGDSSKNQKSKARILEDYLDQCSQGGARNIERELWRGHDEIRTTAQSIYSDAWSKSKVSDSNLFPVTPSGKLFREFESNLTRTFFIHLGEGIDNISRNEWKELTGLKLNQPATTIIHGTAFSDEEFAEMGMKGQSLAWSPTSNLLLYKKTTDVSAALKNNVNVSIGSDWSLSGTKSLLYELKVAYLVNKKYYDNKISDQDLLKMVTINGARASHLENFIGSLEKGKLADFFIIQKKNSRKTPFETLLMAEDSSIDAVFVHGMPISGQHSAMNSLLRDLNLDGNFSTVKDKSCSGELIFNLPSGNAAGMISELNEKTNKAFYRLKPALQNALGEEFSRIDPLCSEKDLRMKQIINSL